MFGVTTISIGSYIFIIIGMPCGMQAHDRRSLCRPTAWRARLASYTALYSGVSGAVCVPLSHRLGLMRFHCPLRSGYRDSFGACAPAIVVSSDAASAIVAID